MFHLFFSRFFAVFSLQVPEPPAIFAAVARFDPFVGGAPYVKAVGGYGQRISTLPANSATKNDITRIGSNTKSFTASLFAMAVRSKREERFESFTN